MHNFRNSGILDEQRYKHYVELAPIFIRTDVKKLSSFIYSYIKKGDNAQTLYLIENGKIKPSKILADSLVSLISGNKELVLIDDQKEVFEHILHEAKGALKSSKKLTIIVKGGPGSGKSVVAINLLVSLLSQGLTSFYVTKNAAPRSVYQYKLTGALKSRYGHLFKSSDSFWNVEANSVDILLVDEAHRLREGSGFFNNQGENQIKEIVNSAKVSVFFVDDDQLVTMHDIGTSEEIIKVAQSLGSKLVTLKLTSQFRCNGSDGYTNWLDNVLQIRPTANVDFNELDFDFKVFDDAGEMHETIKQLNSKYPLPEW